MPGLNWTQAVNPNYWLIAPQLIITATLLLVMIIDFYVKEKRQLVWVTLAGVVLSMGSVFYVATDRTIQAAIDKGQPLEFFGDMMIADGFTFFMNAVLLGVVAILILLSVDYVEKFLRGAFLEFYQVVLSATLGMMFMVSSRDLITIYIGLELSSICSYVLAGLLRKDPRSNEAALKYFLNGAIASAVLLFGVSILYGVSGTTRLPEIAMALAGQGALGPMGEAMIPMLVTGIIFVAGGFAFKVAAVPMHLWAPDVYEGSPTPVTGFFSAGPKVAGFAALLRIFVGGLGVAPFVERWTLIWAVLAAASMFVGNITALKQTNIKRMMAYSSIAQAGYILVGVTAAGGLQSSAGVSSVLFYVMAYAITNLGIFAILTHLDQEGGWVTIEDFKGLANRNPVYAWSLLLFFVSLIGIPPTVGFMGKLFLFQAAAGTGYLWLALVMAVNSAISVGYYYGVVKAMFLEESDKPALKGSFGIMTTVVITAAAVVLVTVLANPFINWTSQAAFLK
ncbi:MAG: NADH-quinone oxidoreductase subunit N [Bacillota bacterium]